MHAFLAKKLKRAFDAAMKEHFPELEKIRDKTWPKTPVYRLRIDDRGHVFVALEVQGKYNAYTLELAWSRADSYPWNAELQLSLDEGEGAENRVAMFFSPSQKTAYMWNVVTGSEGLRADRPQGPEAWTKEAMAAELHREVDRDMPEQVDAAVADTMKKLHEILPPFIERARRELARAAS
jgi:hypothetical protein